MAVPGAEKDHTLFLRQQYSVGEYIMKEDNIQREKMKGRQLMNVLLLLLGVALLVLLLKYIGVTDYLRTVFNSLKALIFGMIFAFLLAGISVRLEEFLDDRIDKPRAARIISVLISLLILIGVIVAVALLVLPQLTSTLTTLLPSIRSMVADFNQTVAGLSDSAFWQERICPMVEDFTSNLTVWVVQQFGFSSDTFQSLSAGISSTLSTLVNILVGMILSAYLLLTREEILGKLHKLFCAVFRKKWGERLTEGMTAGVQIFASFFGSKVIEAVLMGLICFFAMCIMQLPCATLISVLVGFANIIPFFGPMIGLVIGALLLVILNPMSALWFAIMMVVLIQVDGNLLGPKILGESTGLSPLEVIISILFFGGCFGFWGALAGVPITAWIYYCVKRVSEHRLAAMGEPVETAAYHVQLRERKKKRMLGRKKSASEQGAAGEKDEKK